jgi:hypothetical protein
VGVGRNRAQEGNVDVLEKTRSRSQFYNHELQRREFM